MSEPAGTLKQSSGEPSSPGLFALALVLFMSWMGWLLCLVLTASQPTVLSRPQFAIADVVVVAALPEPKPAVVRILEVLRGNAGRLLPDGMIPSVRILNLEDCTGWTEPGDYLVPLVASVGKDADFLVPSIPWSPGLPRDHDASRPRIYRISPEVLVQFERLRAR